MEGKEMLDDLLHEESEDTKRQQHDNIKASSVLSRRIPRTMWRGTW
jgi:hypothetical protein